MSPRGCFRSLTKKCGLPSTSTTTGNNASRLGPPSPALALALVRLGGKGSATKSYWKTPPSSTSLCSRRGAKPSATSAVCTSCCSAETVGARLPLRRASAVARSSSREAGGRWGNSASADSNKAMTSSEGAVERGRGGAAEAAATAAAVACLEAVRRRCLAGWGDLLVRERRCHGDTEMR